MAERREERQHLQAAESGQTAADEATLDEIAQQIAALAAETEPVDTARDIRARLQDPQLRQEALDAALGFMPLGAATKAPQIAGRLGGTLRALGERLGLVTAQKAEQVAARPPAAPAAVAAEAQVLRAPESIRSASELTAESAKIFDAFASRQTGEIGREFIGNQLDNMLDHLRRLPQLHNQRLATTTEAKEYARWFAREIGKVEEKLLGTPLDAAGKAKLNEIATRLDIAANKIPPNR